MPASVYLFSIDGGRLEKFGTYPTDRLAVKSAYNRAANYRAQVSVFRMDHELPLKTVPAPSDGRRS